jgi:hypothetical protein
MEEKEFVEKVDRLTLTYLDLNLSVEIPIYYSLDDEENVMVDFESMKEEFDEKIAQLKKISE